MDTVGKILFSRRNELNLSIENISNELNISKSILLNLELDKIKQNSDMVFFIGHLRSYSNHLNLNESHIIDLFKKQYSFKKNILHENIQKPKITTFDLSKFKIVPISIGLIIMICFYNLFILDNHTQPNYALVPDIPENLVPIIESADKDSHKKINQSQINQYNESSVFASDKVVSPISEIQITLKFTNPTWFQLRDDENNIIISKLMEKNDEYSYKLNHNYNITAGNAGNIIVLIDNKVMGKIGKLGQVVDSLTIDQNFNN